MSPVVLKWIIILSASINFGFMAFDGARALAIGDYIRPKTGQFAGQLGPWSNLVSAAGINPESRAMKIIFLGWGIVGLAMTFCFVLDLRWAWMGLLLMSISTLWYLIPGTGLSALQIILLLILRSIR